MRCPPLPCTPYWSSTQEVMQTSSAIYSHDMGQNVSLLVGRGVKLIRNTLDCAVDFVIEEDLVG